MKKHLALLLMLSAPLAWAQTPPPLNHDFDFWLGDWNVSGADGSVAGTNRIESVAGGRALYENWEGAPPPNSPPGTSGGNGKSLNAYNPAKKQWQQFWVGAGGNILELSGGLVDGRMVLASGERKLHDGRSLINRIAWTPNPDGTVRQLWDQSFDGGKIWTVVFDGLYRKKSAPAAH